MTMNRETLVLGDELERLDDEVADVADALEDADPDSKSAEILQSRGNELDQQGGAVAWLVDEHGADAEVVVEGLDAGAFGKVEDRAAAYAADAKGGDAPGATRNVFAAAGLVDAPFLDAEAPDLDAKLQAVASQPPGVAMWLEARIDELTTVTEGNWTPLRERLTASGED